MAACLTEKFDANNPGRLRAVLIPAAAPRRVMMRDPQAFATGRSSFAQSHQKIGFLYKRAEESRLLCRPGFLGNLTKMFHVKHFWNNSKFLRAGRLVIPA
jgi:hypothetical protein